MAKKPVKTKEDNVLFWLLFFLMPFTGIGFGTTVTSIADFVSTVHSTEARVTVLEQKSEQDHLSHVHSYWQPVVSIDDANR